MTICHFDKFFILNKNSDFVGVGISHNIETDDNVLFTKIKELSSADLVSYLFAMIVFATYVTMFKQIHMKLLQFQNC